MHHCSQNTFGGAAQGCPHHAGSATSVGQSQGHPLPAVLLGTSSGAVTIPWHLEHVGSYPCSALQLTGVCAATNISINSHNI